MPDTIISTAVTAEALPQPKSLKTLLKEYRKTYKEWNVALSGDYEKDKTEEESSAYQEAAMAPCHAAIDAMIEAPVVSLEDIAIKLRFYFQVVKDGDAGVDLNSWEGRIVANILRDIEKPKSSSLRELRERCKAAFKAAAQADLAEAKEVKEAADQNWLDLDKQFVLTPAVTLDDMIVKLEFLTTMKDMSEDPSGSDPDQVVFGLIEDLKRMTGAKR